MRFYRLDDGIFYFLFLQHKSVNIFSPKLERDNLFPENTKNLPPELNSSLPNSRFCYNNILLQCFLYTCVTFGGLNWPPTSALLCKFEQ